MRAFLISAILLFSVQSASATMTRDFDRKSLRVLYLSPILDKNSLPTLSANQIGDLGTLFEAGMNTIVAIVPDDALVTNNLNGYLTSLVSYIRSIPALASYRYFISLAGPICDGYSPADHSLKDPTKHLLDQLVAVEVGNPDLFIGYYTFDEPTRIDGIPNTCPVASDYQEAVYQYIRIADLDAIARPVAIANNYLDPGITSFIGDRGSINATDLVWIDQYTSDTIDSPDPAGSASDLTQQENLFVVWQFFNQISKPVVLVLRDYEPSDVGSCHPGNLWRNSNLYDQALQHDFPSGITRYGYGYFSYWLLQGDQRGWGFGMENCSQLFNDAWDHVSSDHTDLAKAWLGGTNKTNGVYSREVIEPYATFSGGPLGFTNFEFNRDGSGFTRHVPITFNALGPNALAYLPLDVNGDGTTDALEAWANGGSLAMTSFINNGKQVSQGWGTNNAGTTSSASSIFLPLLTNWDACTDFVQLFNNNGRVGLNTFIASCSGSNNYILNQSVNDAGAGFTGQFIPLDFNGDQRTDFVQIWNNNPNIGSISYQSAGGSYSIVVGNNNLGTNLNGTIFAGRVNADTKDDLISISCNGVHTRIDTFTSNGSNFALNSTNNDTGQGCSNLGFLPGDFNNDGRTDLLHLWNNGGWLAWIIYTGNGNSLTFAKGGTTGLNAGGSYSAVDLNQDGRTDLLQQWNDGLRVRYNGYLASGSPPTLTQSFSN
jgi:hypothetical protein